MGTIWRDFRRGRDRDTRGSRTWRSNVRAPHASLAALRPASAGDPPPSGWASPRPCRPLPRPQPPLMALAMRLAALIRRQTIGWPCKATAGSGAPCRRQAKPRPIAKPTPGADPVRPQGVAKRERRTIGRRACRAWAPSDRAGFGGSVACPPRRRTRSSFNPVEPRRLDPARPAAVAPDATDGAHLTYCWVDRGCHLWLNSRRCAGIAGACDPR